MAFDRKNRPITFNTCVFLGLIVLIALNNFISLMALAENANEELNAAKIDDMENQAQAKLGTSSKNFSASSYQYFESSSDSNNGSDWKGFKRPFGPSSAIAGIFSSAGPRSNPNSYMQRSGQALAPGVAGPFSAGPFSSLSSFPLFGFQRGN